MKAKEIKNLAKKIAQQELIIMNSTSLEEKSRAEQEIIRLSACVKSIDDMIAVDDAVQEILAKNS